MSKLLDGALLYARAGCPVFPIARDKAPLTAHGFKDATTNEDQLRAWFAHDPANTNIGVHCRGAGWVVLDVDPRNGGDRTLATLEVEYGPLPRTLVQRSHDGGLHIVMRDPNAARLFGKLDRHGKGTGIDVKWNGYIVVEPSVHATGHIYEWINHERDASGRFVLPDVPIAWLPLIINNAPTTIEGAGIDLWEESACVRFTAGDQLRAELRDLGLRGSGKSTTFNAIKRVFHDFGCSLDEGLPYLLEWNASNGKPYDGAELTRQLHRIAAQPLKDPRGYRSFNALQDVATIYAPIPGSFDEQYQIALAEVRSALGKASQSTSVAPKPLFEQASVFMKRKFPQVPWLVRPLVKEGGTGVVGGEPKTGKTWVLTEIARALATGMHAFGHFITGKPKRGAYFYAEDLGGDVQAHITALGKGASMTAAQWELLYENLFVEPRGSFLDVMRDEDLARIVASCRRLGHIDFLCLEPLRDISSAAEDKSDEMAPVMRRLRLLGELLGCTVLTAHHNKKHSDGDRGGQAMRGSGAIHGAIDSGVYLSGLSGNGITTFVNRVESEIKGARSAGKFDLTLEITDGMDDRAEIAKWTYAAASSQDEKKAAAASLGDAAEGDRLIAAVRARALAGEYFTATAWEQNSGMGQKATRRAWSLVGPTGTKQLMVTEWHPKDRIRSKGAGFVVPMSDLPKVDP